MLKQGSELGQGGVVVADRGPGAFVSFLLLPIGFCAGAIPVLKLIAAIHGSTQGLVWVAALGGLLAVGVGYQGLLRVYDWVDAHRKRVPRAELDHEGVTIFGRHGHQVRIVWDRVAGMAQRDGGTWLVGPAGEAVAEVPVRLLLIDPGLAYEVVRARRDRFALGGDGRRFTLRTDAGAALDPDAWLYEQRLGSRLDLLVLIGGGLLILGLGAERTGEVALFVWGVFVVIWLAVFRGPAAALVGTLVGPGAGGAR